MNFRVNVVWTVVIIVTVNNNSPIQDYVHPDDHNQPTFKMTPGFKSFTITELLTLKYEETFPLVIH